MKVSVNVFHFIVTFYTLEAVSSSLNIQEIFNLVWTMAFNDKCVFTVENDRPKSMTVVIIYLAQKTI